MKNRILAFIGISLGLFVIAAILFVSFSPPKEKVRPEPLSKSEHKIILLPLDSRPPCLDFPQQLGLLGNMEVIAPPQEFMDQNLQPAKKEELLIWLEKEAPKADAIILSTDMLLHGGLVASRRISPDQLTEEYQKQWVSQVDSLISRLWALKKAYPHLKIYSFSIIPRQLVSGEPPASYYEPHLYHYSQYSDKVAQFELPKDINKLADWRSILPDDVLRQYMGIFQRNLDLNKRLISETEAGLFTRLIIAQDDAQPFGIPNGYRQWAEQFALEKKVLNQQVFFTGGTDEIAQLLLARYAIEEKNQKFSIFPYYTDSKTPHRIFPFMREAIDTNTYEKFRILGAEIAPTAEEADLILTIHGGFPEVDPYSWQQSAQQVKKWLLENKAVAVVDVARDFNKIESFLPYLLDEKAPLLQLQAYAGWNTASNSIGTALSQGILFKLGKDGDTPPGTLPARRDAQVRFLLARFVDDWAYQKDVQDANNDWLQFVGTNPYELGSIASEKISKKFESDLHGQFSYLYRRNFFSTPYRFSGSEGTREFWLTNAKMRVTLPWERTFEIKLEIIPQWQLKK